jgi:hypothetical protein
MKQTIQAYIECARWTTDIDGVLSPEAQEQMAQDCRSFLDFVEAQSIDHSAWDETQLGHDFWLSRNGHGTGFWDRGLPNGDTLHVAAKTFGECHLELGDGGQIYIL